MTNNSRALRSHSSIVDPQSSALRSTFEERPQLAATGGVPQLAQRLRFDLADALPRDGEVLTHLFERVLAAVAHAKPHLDDFLFAGRQRLQYRLGLFLQIQVDDRVGG